jgi:hypothetical protein
MAAAGLAVPAFVAVAAVAVHDEESADRLSYAYFGQGDQSSLMSGSMDDWRGAKALRVGKEAMLYVRQGGTAYVIRDVSTLRRVDALLEPQQVLGRKQGELGRRQGELGKEQGRLGRMRANPSARGQGELGRQQAALGARQAALGKEQAMLGREQARLTIELNAKLRTLVAEAIARGEAQRVN